MILIDVYLNTVCLFIPSKSERKNEREWCSEVGLKDCEFVRKTRSIIR
nr:MAG TPA: hypothetical protein [Bacteriophage sp.]